MDKEGSGASFGRSPFSGVSKPPKRCKKGSHKRYRKNLRKKLLVDSIGNESKTNYSDGKRKESRDHHSRKMRDSWNEELGREDHSNWKRRDSRNEEESSREDHRSWKRSDRNLGTGQNKYSEPRDDHKGRMRRNRRNEEELGRDDNRSRKRMHSRNEEELGRDDHSSWKRSHRMNEEFGRDDHRNWGDRRNYVLESEIPAEDDPDEDISGSPAATLAVKHPLEHEWTFWYFYQDKNRAWEENLRTIKTVSTIEDFWAVLNWIEPPSRLQTGADYSLFKAGISPDWEDMSNRKGGRWVVDCGRQGLDGDWKEVIMAMVGQQFGEAQDTQVNGAVVSLRNRGDRVAVWVREVAGSDKVGDIMSKVLGRSGAFKVHKKQEKELRSQQMIKLRKDQIQNKYSEPRHCCEPVESTSASYRPLAKYTMSLKVLDKLGPNSLFDSHCHLDFILFKRLPHMKLESFEQFLHSYPLMNHSSLEGFITNFCSPMLWMKHLSSPTPLIHSLLFCPSVYYTIGCHPHFARELLVPCNYRMLKQLLENAGPSCVAVGECGLDTSGKNTTRMDDQVKVFKMQVELAIKMKKPLVLHIRDAEVEAFRALEEVKLPADWPIHR